MGSPGRAMYLCENPSGELAGEAEELLDLCMAGDWQRCAVRVDDLAARGDLDRNERLFMHLAYSVRGGFLRALPGSATYIDAQDFSTDGGKTDRFARL